MKRALASSCLLLGISGSSLLGGLLEGRLGLNSREDLEVRVAFADSSNGTALEAVPDEGASDRSVDLELFAERGAGDAENLCHFLRNLFVALLVEEDVVVELVLDLDLGPGLLFRLAALLAGLRSL